jgi:hypothetical protein
MAAARLSVSYSARSASVGEMLTADEPGELTPVQRRRVLDCLHFDGQVRSARF